MSAFSKRQVVDLQCTSFNTTDVKTKFSGLDSNIIYKAQISLFTCHLERNAVNRVAAAVGAGDAAQVSTFVSICLGCLLLLFGACSSTEHNVSLFGLWRQDANRPLNRSMPSPLLLVVFCSTGCESLLVSLFVAVLFFQQSLLMVSFGGYPFKQL